MKVRNKLESIEIIKNKKLNSFPEQLFYKNQTKEIIKFLDDNPAEYYAVRSKEIVGCKKNNFKVPRSNVLNEINNFNLFTINVSSYNFTPNLILIGDIMFGKNNEVWFIGSTNKNFTGKMAEQNPDYNFFTNIFDKRLNTIPGFDIIYKYIVDHDLLDVIVEFAIYDIPVGLYNEQVIVFEIRTEFWTQKCVLFLCLGGGKEMTIINYFFETVVPQILEYFKENKEEIPNYLMLEVLKKDKQYQELIDKILEQPKEENDNNKKGE